MASLPSSLNETIRDSAGACAAIYSLLLSTDEKVRDVQLAILSDHAGQAVSDRMKTVVPLIEGTKKEVRLPIADVAVSTLKHLSVDDYERFTANLEQLVNADKQIDLFEYALQRMIQRRLEPTFHKVKPTAVQYYDLSPLLPASAKLLSCLAYWGADEMPAAHRAFAAGWEKLGKTPLSMLPIEQCGLQALEESLAELNQGSPAVKRTLLSACTACVGADALVTVEEADLLRAVADALDCPIPPFLPGEKA
jgi:hypothetical protein